MIASPPATTPTPDHPIRAQADHRTRHQDEVLSLGKAAGGLERLLERADERNPLLSKRLLIDSFHFPVWPELARTECPDD